MKAFILSLFLTVCQAHQAMARPVWMRVTAYCACRICTGHHSGGPTASGVMPRAGVTAAGPAWMDFGTLVQIPGVGWRRVEDRMAGRPANRLDVFMDSHVRARKFGVRWVRLNN